MNIVPAISSGNVTSASGAVPTWQCPGCNQWVAGAHVCTGLPPPDALERIAVSLERIVAILEPEP
jgi:hypothetical protein